MRALITCSAISLVLAACGEPGPEPVVQAENTMAAEGGMAEPAALNPPAPGEPGGLPDDRTPLVEGPIEPGSGQDAGQVLQQYWIAIEQGRFADAYDLWGDDGAASGMSEDAFAASFDKYSEIHANIGAPGEVEGAAGSLYVEIPVQAYGRLAESGEEFNMLGPMTLRRVNDVPGATEDQLHWHIEDSGLKPRP